MLSGVKFISREQIHTTKGEESTKSKKKRKTSSSKKQKRRIKKRDVENSSSEDEQLERLAKHKKKKWYSSDEYSTSTDDESESESEEDEDRGRRKVRSKGKRKAKKDDEIDTSGNIDIVRKEMGLEWMSKPAERANKNVESAYERQPEEPASEEQKMAHPKELNPYLRNNGSGYPEDVEQTKKTRDHLLSSSLVGDGGASWRLKALKRAQEQAAREGQNVEEVVQERWGSFGHLAVSVASHSAAAPRAHLGAIKSRKLGAREVIESDPNKKNQGDAEKVIGHEGVDAVSAFHSKKREPSSALCSEMRAPKVHDSLSWGRKKGQIGHDKDADLISKAVSRLNKFNGDGNFMKTFVSQHEKTECKSHDVSSLKSKGIQESVSNSAEKTHIEEKSPLSANQLAAKAMQLRLRGKHAEADKLLGRCSPIPYKETKVPREDEDKEERLTKLRNDVTASRYASKDLMMRQRDKEDDSDIHLAKSITKNKLYSMSTQADDEYDYDGPPTKKSRRKGTQNDNRHNTKQDVGKRIITQQERCVFCFENAKRPKHLVVAIANFVYLMLPQYQQLAPGHCCIVTLQHESATRMVDDNVWEEIRNFKKCLIMMFAKEDKEMIFLETVIGLAQQRRHCLIECIPLPKDLAAEAPLYFKKAIDEAEDEWSQHNAKKLIDTSQKGLRSSIPKNFPYFHVEFGLKRGFVHVIDDETQFKTDLGVNVIRGMLQSRDEDMYRRRRYESIDVQREAVAAFAKDWQPFDWTEQLD